MWVGNMAGAIVELWNSIIASVYAVLTQDPKGGTWGGAWGMATSINQAIMSVAVALALVFWAISFFKYIEDFHKIDMREAAGWILRFAIIYVIIGQTMTIMEAFLELAMGVNAEIMATPAFTQHVANMGAPTAVLEAVEEINTSGNVLEIIIAFFESLPISLFFLLLMLVILCCGVVILVALFMRFFKLYIYTALAPLPLSTLAGSTSSEVGKHFIKAWASVCLEICVISIAVAIFAASMGDTSDIFHFGASMGGAEPAAISEQAARSIGDGIEGDGSIVEGNGGNIGSEVTDGEGNPIQQPGEGEWSVPGIIDSDSMPNLGNLWTVSINWALNVLIKSVLLVSIIKGSDRIMEKIIGT